MWLRRGKSYLRAPENLENWNDNLIEQEGDSLVQMLYCPLAWVTDCWFIYNSAAIFCSNVNPYDKRE